ncbi:hypothetical protein I4U23_005933 [Adineta vaga]|nr:hypothetical protein I4U23_005933 [Adineta vaga]
MVYDYLCVKPLPLPPVKNDKLVRTSFEIHLNVGSILHEAKSARSGRFNTLPKRPHVDKFKHRSGPNAQKHL